MRYQSTPYNCGPASLQNALKVLRRHVSQDKLAELAATTEAEGTDEEGIKRAALAVGFGVDEISESSPTTAWQRLLHSVLMGRPVVFCVDRWSHWVTAVGLSGYHVLVADPARFPYLLRENGVLVLNKDRLVRRWRAARRVRGKDGPAYYGIAIGQEPCYMP